jgi:hypothetical protein
MALLGSLQPCLNVTPQVHRVLALLLTALLFALFDSVRRILIQRPYILWLLLRKPLAKKEARILPARSIQNPGYECPRIHLV